MSLEQPTSDQSSPNTKAAIRGGAATLVSRVLAQLIQFAIFVVAAQVLEPADFGIFALVSAVIVLLNQLAMAGWPEYIMQLKGDVLRMRQALYVAGVSGVLFAALGVFASWIFADRYSNPAILPIAQLLSISIFFSSIGAAYAGALIWQHKLSSAAACSLLSEIVNFVIAVWALLEGFGILALAYGRLAASITGFVSGVVTARVSPSGQVGFEFIKELLVFSKHFIAARFLVNLRIYAATFIIGGLIGATAVGYYRAAQRVIAGFEEIVGEPTRVLSWNLFRQSRDKHDGIGGFDELSQAFFKIQIYGAVPLFVGLAIMASDLVEGLLGSEWTPASPVVQILAIASLVRVSGHASFPVLSLAGKTSMLPSITFRYSIITIFCISIGAIFGIITTAFAELFAAVIVFMLNAQIMRNNANSFWNKILMGSWKVLPATAIAMAFPLFSYQFDIFDQLLPLVRFFLLSLCIVSVYVPIILLLDKPFRDRVVSSLPSRSS